MVRPQTRMLEQDVLLRRRKGNDVPKEANSFRCERCHVLDISDNVESPPGRDDEMINKGVESPPGPDIEVTGARAALQCGTAARLHRHLYECQMTVQHGHFLTNIVLQLLIRLLQGGGREGSVVRKGRKLATSS